MAGGLSVESSKSGQTFLILSDEHVPREKNQEADRLSQLATAEEAFRTNEVMDNTPDGEGRVPDPWRGEKASCRALLGKGFGGRRPTLGLTHDGEAGGEGEREANFTLPADFALLEGGGDAVLVVRLVRDNERALEKAEKNYKI
ncbi:hypothetical protein LIER_05932 [Lithospermum erythrorhizon]|uniref:RNase H type-1 domain-containing protein n=1 Tax=Lithospermum erythrorhizon TaxID=34254 RepID=A0AAV3P6H3_LITER